ncbi:TPA: hypothetical protein ACXI73_004225 [Stenotrophomonas maltophilia]
MLFRERDGALLHLYRATIRDTVMIIGFRHKGLERLYRSGISSGVRHSHTSRVLMILSILDAASAPGVSPCLDCASTSCGAT